MKTPTFPRSARQIAFTLIELLIVIAVIVVLAGLLMPVMTGVAARRMATVAKVELVQMTTAIHAYHADKGFYPPNNPARDPQANALYYELVGTTNNVARTAYWTLDGKDTITTNDLGTVFGLGSLANSAASTKPSDDAAAPQNFLKGLKPDQVKAYAGGNALILVCSEGWTYPGAPPTATAGWRYRANGATNNPGSFDLWVDLFIKGKTNRFNNWSKEPLINR